MSSQVQEGALPPMQYSLESYDGEHPISPPENYPIPEAERGGASETILLYNYGRLSMEEKKEFLEITRTSVEVLSSLMSSAAEPNLSKDDLTISMLEKCKDSQPLLQRIVESTTDDEGTLFEALNLHDELHRVISKFEEMEVSGKPEAQPPQELSTVDTHSPTQIGARNGDVRTDSAERENSGGTTAADFAGASVEPGSNK